MGSGEEFMVFFDTAFCVGIWFTLRTVVKRLVKLEKKGKPSEAPVCVCGHGANYHDEKGCRETTKRWTGRNKQGDKIMTLDPCRCVRYVGPGSTYDPGFEQDYARAMRSQEDSR